MAMAGRLVQSLRGSSEERRSWRSEVLAFSHRSRHSKPSATSLSWCELDLEFRVGSRDTSVGESTGLLGTLELYMAFYGLLYARLQGP